MNKRVRKQMSKDFTRNGSKSDLSDLFMSELGVSSDQNILIPMLKLPSVDLCVSNTYPISCVEPKFKDKQVEKHSSMDFTDSCPPNVSHSSEDISKGESNEKATKDKLDLLNGQLYLMNLLHRIIKLGFYNKREILSLYHFTIGKNSMFNLNFSNSNAIKILIKSRLSRLSNYKFIHNRLFSNDDLEDVCFDPDNILCFDNSTFSLFDTFLIHTKATSDENLSDPEYSKTLNEDQMLSNLLNGKLCNGKETTPFERFVLSILLINKYDYLSPNFINLVLSSSKVNNCDF